jgi:hypothetical protein
VGPRRGYLTSIALRAAQASSTMVRPLSISCHYLNEATFGPCELDVEILRSTDRYESLLVRMTQDGKDILVCLVSAAPSGLLGPEITWHEKPTRRRRRSWSRPSSTRMSSTSWATSRTGRTSSSA